MAMDRGSAASTARTVAAGMAWALALSALAAPGVTRAQAPAAEATRGGTLLLVRTPGDDAIVRHILGELGAADWHVVELEADPRLQHEPLPGLARSHAADAGLRVDAVHAQVELWAAGAGGNEPGKLETLGAQDTDRSVLAVQVAEVLRALSLSLARGRAPVGPPQQERLAPPEPPRPKPPAPAQPPSAAPAQPRPQAEPEPEEREQPTEPPRPISWPRLWLELAPAASFAPGGLGAALQGLASARLQPARAWSIALFALVPLLNDSLQQAEGRARVSNLLVGATLELHLAGARSELTLSSGAALLVSSMSGQATAPLRGVHDTVFAAALLVGPAAHVELGGGFRLCARALAGLTLPRIAVHLAGRQAASWGRPLLVGTLGLERAF